MKKYTPCDEAPFICPYMASDGEVNCEYWCGEDEPPDDPPIEEDYDWDQRHVINIFESNP